MNPPPMSEVCTVLLFRREDGAVLLQHRDEKPGLRASGLWVFPGGHREPGESVEACAEREFREETEYPASGLVWRATILDDYEAEGAPMRLHLFSGFYDGSSPYVCREGQALAFRTRVEAESLPMPPYLRPLWDAVWIMMRANADRSGAGVCG